MINNYPNGRMVVSITGNGFKLLTNSRLWKKCWRQNPRPCVIQRNLKDALKGGEQITIQKGNIHFKCWVLCLLFFCQGNDL